MQQNGEEIPEPVSVQAQYDAEEAELQRAIEESKALMEAEMAVEMSKADEKLNEKQEDLKKQLSKKLEDKEQKIEEIK